MAYESRHLRRQKVRYNSTNDDNLLVYQLLVGEQKVTPTSATITIYAPGSTTALVSAASMTVTGSLLTYAVVTTTTANYPIQTGYRAEIVVTYATKTYDRVVIFDVVKFLLDIGVGRDQLVSMDSRLSAMDHNGDGDFSEVIAAVRDEINHRLETKAHKDGQLVENMILDTSRVSIPARNLVLSQIFYNHGNTEEGKRYEDRFKELFGAMLSGISYDTGQEGEESAVQGGIQMIRMVT